MATYVPNASTLTEPTASRTVGSAAEEFRVLKTSLDTRADLLDADLTVAEAAIDALEVDVAELQTQMAGVAAGTDSTALAAALGSFVAGQGSGLVGVSFSARTVEQTLADSSGFRDIRSFAGIVADNVTNDLAAFQVACVTARNTGCGIYFPAGVKVFLEFSATTPHLFIDGKVSLVAADPFTGGLRLNCNYDMPAGHAPLICWGIPSKGAAVNKVSGRVSIGYWLTAGCGRFERANHIYGAQDFTVEGCWVDFTQVTWPAADGGHPSGYQAGGWFSSNVQGTFATGQTQDRNIQFIRNVGFASAEYQNGESVGITRCKGLRYINNYLYGFADDLAAHECVDVLMLGNHYEAVSGRLYFDNCQHVRVVNNYITSIQKPSGGFLGPTRTYITGNMYTQYAAVTWDAPNYDVLVHGNTVVIPAGGYCTTAVHMYGVQDGLTITDNHFYMSGSPAAQAAAIGISTLYRAGWTGPAGNPDYAAGGAVKTRSVTVRGNQCIGAGWGATDGNLGVVVYVGGASSDIIGPVDIDGNIAGAYYIPYEAVRFGRNFATPAATDPFLNLSMIAMWDKQPPLWVGLLPASANINNTNFPQATPTFYTLSDSDGMKFIAQRAGRVLGAHMQLTANMTAGNNCVLRVLKNGTQIGADTDSATNSPTINPSRYIWNFFGVSGMTFVEGDKIELQVTIRTAQGGTSIVGRINLVAQYS